MFVNGALVDGEGGEEDIAPGTALALGDAQLCIGNRDIGSRAPDGEIYYAAFYAVALDVDEITANVTRLLANDD
jgi:hypothetical protein